MSTLELRRWQREALAQWKEGGRRGIVSVVTGAGKTIFALACVYDASPATTLIVVPTLTLLDQWWEEAAAFFGLSLDEINIVTGRRGVRSGTVNIAVLNTAAKLASEGKARRCMLVVDECHRAASPRFRAALEVPLEASLGLSATPDRQYDDGLSEVLIPALGPIIYDYSYANALADGVIVPFFLQNVVFELEDECQAEYDRLTRSLALSIARHGADAERSVALMLKRARVLNLSLNRVRLALKIAAAHRGQRVIIFHEDIDACNLIHDLLGRAGFSSGVYHSRLPLRARAEVLAAYRRGGISVLVSCRALDEGFNIPETEVGVIAASTATRRQRIQRLGRVLRPAKNKGQATVYSLVATDPEIARLRGEEKSLEGVASVTWSRA